MRVVSLFNNKGGVGKSTLAFHLSNILAERGHKVLMIDLDPQCNLTICGMNEELLHEIWREEDLFIDDFETAKQNKSQEELSDILSRTRTIHFLLKPTEDGQGDLSNLPPAYSVRTNLDLIPGRLTVYQYENKISERWSGAYSGDPLSIRTITKIRELAENYYSINNYDFIIIDTSPSLGALNKVIISMVDGFLIPALPDMFSSYGIRNIGNALNNWKKEFNTIYGLISEDKRLRFPENFVRFLGYTIYNAKKYSGNSPWDLALAHYNYAQEIPAIIEQCIDIDVRGHLSEEQARNPMGGTAVMHSHNTLPNMAQKYKLPIWAIPSCPNLDIEDKGTIMGNRKIYEATREKYIEFSDSFIERVNTLN
ncbi:ParA family protein [Bacteroides faecium]|uniref:ParA family protein n=1 Tax=Bacteroides faecium TaxID=2715212 RepID=A0A6H0KXE1_9BACE|nr:AAA family ATPase [Bacteroides faecium]QIU97128.1 ParA family protein [Bacteroides faecium]